MSNAVDPDYVVTQPNMGEELNATVLIPDPASSSLPASSLTKANSSFLRLGQYEASEEGDRSPANMGSAARGVLIQTTGGLFFTINEAAYQEFSSNLDLYVKGNATNKIDGNSSTTIGGTNDVNTTGVSRHTGQSFTISTGGYTNIQPSETNDIRLKSDNKVDIESDKGVKMAVGSSHYAKIDSEGLWQTNFAKAIDVTTGTTHSRFGGWTTEEYYGGKFTFNIAFTIELSIAINISINALVDISVGTISLSAGGIELGYRKIDIEVQHLRMDMTNIDISRAIIEVNTRDAIKLDIDGVNVSKTSVKLATGLNIIS